MNSNSINGSSPVNTQPVESSNQGQGMTGKEAMDESVTTINGAGNNAKGGDWLSGVSLDTLMLSIMTDRAELLEGTLRTQVDQVRAKNDQLKEANEILASARGAKSNTGEEGRTAVPPEVAKFFDDNNIKWNGNATQNSSQWGLAIENLKGFSESLTSTSQLDMTKLQSTSGKFNQTFEMMSQFVSKYYRSSDSLIKNMG
ncbi:MAG: hypothetical protein KAG53_05735 [Endozoicomonadaceae bacterium]|nr:hypothetical protein [Endozoicomonadaceae bacterium]